MDESNEWRHFSDFGHGLEPPVGTYFKQSCLMGHESFGMTNATTTSGPCTLPFPIHKYLCMIKDFEIHENETKGSFIYNKVSPPILNSFFA